MWQVNVKCSDCSEIAEGEWDGQFSLGKACPTSWTSFGRGMVSYAAYCPPCSEIILQEGKRIRAEREKSGIQRLIGSLLSR